MEVAEKAEDGAAAEVERRGMPRCAVDEEAVLFLLRSGSRVPCRMVELSLEGCRISTLARLSATSLGRVETTFKMRGIAFRLSGMAEWADSRNQVGIRFVEMPFRRRDELAEVLCEVEAEHAAKAEQAAAGQALAEEAQAEKPAAAERIMEMPSPLPAVLQIVQETVRKAADERRPGSEPHAVAEQREPERHSPPEPEGRPATGAAKPGKRERRLHSRHEVDTSAVIFLINIGCRLEGRILDLSLSGCRIRTQERFPVGIYTRVETEFMLEGLPFRLGGVIQAIHDRNHVGIRFLDVSARKRAQVEQLIDEIEELQARLNLAEPESPKPDAG